MLIPNLKRNLRAALLSTAIAGSIAGCGSSADVLGLSRIFVDSDVQYVYDFLRGPYYWYDEVSLTADLTRYDTPEEALTKLKYSGDKFSNISSAAESQALLNDGEIIAFGITYKVENDKLLRVRFVQPSSGAQSVDIRRGDAITAVNGESVETIITEKRLDAAFGGSEIGLTRKFSITRGTQQLEINATKNKFTLNSAPVATVHNVTGAKAGYVVYNQFTQPSQAQLLTAFKQVKDQGATKLIVDLRFNGGGRVDVANAVTSAIVPQSAIGKRFAYLEWNKNYKSNNTDYLFVTEPLAGQFTDVIFLTSPGTCSASEAMINGVAPYLTNSQVTTMGQTTCGKPFGFSAPTRGGKQYNIVVFRVTNGAGKGDYENGLVPECGATDDNQGQLGDAGESMLASALSYFNSGTCNPLVATDSIVGKSIGGKTARDKNWEDYWQLPVNGLARQTGII
jgi:carboxyl-terminal processing protease